MIRPGPPSIIPGACPDGIVFHFYAATEPPRLLMVRRYHPDDVTDDAAEADWRACEAAGAAAVCVVAYDGDTGERFDLFDVVSRNHPTRRRPGGP